MFWTFCNIDALRKNSPGIQKTFRDNCIRLHILTTIELTVYLYSLYLLILLVAKPTQEIL